MEALLYIG